jgi:uncharacterized delta-60 repeat protein
MLLRCAPPNSINLSLLPQYASARLKAAIWRSRTAAASILPLLLLLSLPAVVDAQPVVQEWVQRYDGGNGNDYARAIAVDSSGNVIVTGYSTNYASNYDYVTIKYSSAGVPLWTNRFDGPASGNDRAVALTVDTNADVIITGYLTATNGFTDYATIKYSSAGVPLWTNWYDGPRQYFDYATAIAADGSGNVFVTGYSTGSPNSGYDYATIAYSNAGVPLWTNRYNGAGNREDAAYALAVDTNGNVVVTGHSWNGADYDYLTINYSGAGIPLWTNSFSGPGNSWDVGAAIAVDISGNVFVTGQYYSGTNYAYGTLSYSSAGMPLWTNCYFRPGNSSDGARSIAVDKGGNVYVTGLSYGSGNHYDYVTIAYSGAGLPLWTNRYDGSGKLDDYVGGLVLDANGNVIVTGYSYGGSSRNDYATVAYSSAGMPLWTNRYNGPANADDYAVALAADTSGNVYVTGYSSNGTNYDIVTIKYAPMKPSLTISTVGKQVRAAWPLWAAGWALRRASSIEGPYTDPELSVANEGDQSVAYDNLGAVGGFYCLQKVQ